MGIKLLDFQIEQL